MVREKEANYGITNNTKIIFLRSELLYKKGIDKGEIKPFSEAIYNQMNNVYLGGVPISLLLKIALATNVVGECYAESLYMFLCFPDSFLVRGDLKSISYANNGSSGGHGWVEMNNRVYDPTLGYELPENYIIKFMVQIISDDIRKMTILHNLPKTPHYTNK